MTSDVNLNQRLAQVRGTSGSAVPRFEPDLGVDVRNTRGFRPTAEATAVRAAQLDQRTAQRVQNVSADVFQQQMERIEFIQAAEVEKRTSDISLKLQEAALDIAQNAEPSEIQEKNFDAFNELKEAHLNDKNLTGFQKNLLSQNLGPIREAVGQKAFRAQFEVENVQAEMAVQEKLRTDQRLIFNDPSLLNAKLEELSANLQEVPGISERQAEQFKRQNTRQFAEAAARGMIQDDPAKALEVLNKNQLDKFGISAKQKEQLIGLAERSIQKDEVSFTREEIKAKANLKTRIITNPSSVTDEEIFQSVDEGLLSESEAVQQIIRRDTEKAREQADTVSFGKVKDALQGQSNLSPTRKDDKTVVDKYYQQIIEPVVTDDFSAAERNFVKADYVSETGITPETITNEIASKLVNGTASDVQEAIDLVNRIEESNPEIELGLRAQDRSFIDQVNGALLAAQDPEEAIQNTRRLRETQNESARSSRLNQFNSEFKFGRAQSKAENAIDNFIPFNQAEAPTETMASIRLQEDMKDLALSYYMSNPDIDKAYDYAQKQIKKTWGNTRVGGKRRVMKHPPEKIYNLSQEDINNDLETALKSVDPEIDTDQIMISSDPLTEREIRAGEGTIGYSIFKIDDDGVDYLRDENGMPLRYIPDAQGIVKKKNQKVLDRARKRRENRLQLQTQGADFFSGDLQADIQRGRE